MKKWIALFLSLALLLSGCTITAGSTADTDTDDSNNQDTSPAADADSETENTLEFDTASMFTARDFEVGYDESGSTAILLQGESASCASDTVYISGNIITITQSGSYILSGTLDDGMVIVDTQNTDKVQLVLDGAQISCQDSAAIYILQADKVFLTLAPGSENQLINGGSFSAIDENNIDAVIFSKDDLTLNGTGSLYISSPAGHGIVSKDDLVITSGDYNIEAARHGISGKDSVRIAGGIFSINCGKDGIHAENGEDSALGFLYIVEGDFHITAEADGCSASATAYIEGGSFEIQTGGGSASVTHKESGWSWEQRAQPESSTETETVSAKGIKSASTLAISGGSYSIDTADDALHSNGDLNITGGDFTISTGDDGLHADGTTCIHNGTIRITGSYEGIEGLSVEISGGEIELVSSDDGINAAGGADQSGFGGFGGFGGNGPFSGSTESHIDISGGIIQINASGDGIDSNGAVIISGGEVYISGPEDNADSALDYETQAVITDGLFVAAGASAMAQNFSTDSTQGAILVATSTQPADSTILLADADGAVLLNWTAKKSFDCVLISCPALQQGKTYTLNAGSYTTQFSMDSLIYGGIAGGMGGMPNFRGNGNMGGFGGNGGMAGGKGAPPQ